ncbi:hypothetical protein Tco_0079231 [Tanacetum coccineum]
MMSSKLVAKSASNGAYNLLRSIQKHIDESGSYNGKLASLKQTALGKDFSNPLMVDSLPKTIWLSMHHVIAMKHWLFQSKWLLLVSTASTSVSTGSRVSTVSNSGGRNNNHRKKTNTDTSTDSFTESVGNPNDANPLKEILSLSVIDVTVAMEVQSTLVDQTDKVKIVGGSYPPLPTQGTTPAENTPGKSSYSNVIGKSRMKALNIRTLFTPGGTGLMLLCRWSRYELLEKGL